MTKTIVLLRGNARLRETIGLGFLGPHDGVLDLVPFIDETGAARMVLGTINPDLQTCLIEQNVSHRIRKMSVRQALTEPDVQTVVVQCPGVGYRAERDLSRDLLGDGFRVIWVLLNLGVLDHPGLVARASETEGVEVLQLEPGRAWGLLCDALGIPS
jgi:hypothetical protein